MKKILPLLLLAFFLSTQAHSEDRPFRLSWKSGSYDAAGKYLGGTEVVHLVPHKGKLFASTGVWMDLPYHRTEGEQPWSGSQILRLDSADGKWQLEKQLPHSPIRLTSLNSLTFVNGADGKPLASPVNLLFAGPCSGGRNSVVYTRDDATGKWATTSLPNAACDIRGFCIHRDSVTNVDRIFALVGVAGIFSGTYDATLPSKVRWDEKPDFGPLPLRPMTFVEANGSLYVSSSTGIYRRTDGEKPTWKKVYEKAGNTTKAIGGIRGMMPVRSQVKPGTEAILFFLANKLIRYEPSDNSEHIELDLLAFLGEKLGTPVYFTLAAYSDMLPLVKPGKAEPELLIGCELTVSLGPALLSGKPFYGPYDGRGWVIVRRSPGKYDLAQIDDPPVTDKLALVGVRCIVPSPFAKGKLFLAGFDCNGYYSRETAWIYEAKTDALLATVKPSFVSKKLDPTNAADLATLRQRTLVLLDQLDLNRDGRFTSAGQFTQDSDLHKFSPGRIRLFGKFDTDKDGEITADELLFGLTGARMEKPKASKVSP